MLQSPWTAAVIGLGLFFFTVSWSVLQEIVPDLSIQLRADNAQASVEEGHSELDQLLQEIGKEKSALAERAQQLNEFGLRLQTERNELQELISQIQRRQNEFDAQVTRLLEEEQSNLKKLAKIYAAMPPESAVLILKELEDPALVKILAVMKETEAGLILEQLAKTGEADAKRAAAATERLRLALRTPQAKP